MRLPPVSRFRITLTSASAVLAIGLVAVTMGMPGSAKQHPATSAMPVAPRLLAGGDLAFLRQRLEIPNRPPGSEGGRGGYDGVGVYAVVPIELRNGTGLPKMLDPERSYPVAVDGAEPGERRRMAVQHRDDAAMRGQLIK